MKKPSFENPLIPHARMRALYRALVETRVLARSLPSSAAVPAGLEACWVSAALDLRDGDFILDALGGSLLAHIRRIAQRAGMQAPNRASIRLTQSSSAQSFSGTAAERLLCATGAAMALKAACQGKAVIAFAGHDELKASAWSRVLALTAAEELPLILLALPAPRPRRGKIPAPRIDLERLVSRLPAPGGYVPLPVIAVDAGDTIALYRAVQESLVRARAGGGAVVIDCVDCGVDPVALLGTQLVERRIATPRWLAGIEPALRALMQSLPTA